MDIFHFVAKALEHLEPYVPLMQVVVWPLFLILLIWLFRKQLETVIEAIRKRIECGSPIDAFGVRIGEPATREERQQKLDREIAEVQPQTDVAITESSLSREELIRRYRSAEDLVINKLSAELNIEIVREVHAGKQVSLVFDGVANISLGKWIVVEVKYVRHKRLLEQITRKYLDQVNKFLESTANEVRSSVMTFILAFVIDEEYLGTTEDVVRTVSRVKDEYSLPVHVLAYRLNDLENTAK
jgi:uncharacterized protein with ATP-grasp and redox domains